MSIRIGFFAAKKISRTSRLQVLGRFGFARGGRENRTTMFGKRVELKGPYKSSNRKRMESCFLQCSLELKQDFQILFCLWHIQSLFIISHLIFPHFSMAFLKILSWSNKSAVGSPHQGKFQGKPCRVRGFSVETKGVGWAWTKKPKEQAVLTNTVLFWLQINVLFVDICCNYLE